MPLQEDYQITLDAFHGPLDLLLYLIRRAEVDIQDIPIARIAHEYQAFLSQIDDVDIDLAGDFLVMAATLVEIKSRTLMPPEDQDGAESADRREGLDPVDPRYELVQQLMAYQRYRLAGESLVEVRDAFASRYALLPARANSKAIAASVKPIELELEDVHALDLADAYEHIMASIDLSRLGDHHVEMDDTPIELHEQDLLDRLGRAAQGQMSLQEAFEGRNRSQRVGLFMATLELTRMRRVTVQQNEIGDPIILLLNDDPDDALVIESDPINQAKPPSEVPN